VTDAGTYEPQRFAQVTEMPDWDVLSYVVLGRWLYSDGRVEWCLEYLDDRMGEVRNDGCFRDEADAREAAQREFGIGENDWREGWPGSFGRDWTNG
jgi:hypothetical protein